MKSQHNRYAMFTSSILHRLEVIAAEIDGVLAQPGVDIGGVRGKADILLRGCPLLTQADCGRPSLGTSRYVGKRLRTDRRGDHAPCTQHGTSTSLRAWNDQRLVTTGHKADGGRS